jgi:hypothetical protein
VTVAGQRFTVKAAVVDANDLAPNSFVLAARRDSTLYRFFPHKGIDKGFERISPVRAVVPRQDRSPDVSYRARKGSPTQRRATRFQARRKRHPAKRPSRQWPQGEAYCRHCAGCRGASQPSRSSDHVYKSRRSF